MAGLVSSVGSVVMLKALVQRMVFLGITVLVTVIASDSPVADGYPLDSRSTPTGFLGNNPSPTRTSPSALPELHHAAFQKPESSVALPSISEPIQTSSPSPESSRQLHQAPTSITSLSLSAFTGSTPSQGPQYEEKVTSSKSQNGTLEQMQSNTTPTPGQTLKPPKPTFSETLSNKSFSQIVNSSQLSSNPPGYRVPSITPHFTLSLPEPAEVPSEDFYPTNTMDVDWGSGDYLETISYSDQDKDDLFLVTKVPSDPYNLEENTEIYDTSFPSRVGISPSSLQPVYLSPSSSFMTTHNTIVPHRSIHPSSFSATAHLILPTPHTGTPSTSDVDWGDTFAIQPTDVLLPDMNSLEYYTTQLTKEGNVSAEQKRNVTGVVINATNITPTSGFTSNLTDNESSGDLSGFEPPDDSTTVVPTEENLHLINATQLVLDPSLIPTHFLNPSSSIWNDQLSTTGWSVHTLTGDGDTAVTDSLQPGATPLLPEDLISSSSMTDVHWFVTDSFEDESVHVTTVLTETIAFSNVPTEPGTSDATVTEITSQDFFGTEEPFNNESITTNSTSSNVTLVPPVMLGDEGITEDGVDISTTMTLFPESSDVNTVSAVPTSQPGTTNPHHTTTTTDTSTVNAVSTTMTDETTTSRQYLCNADRPAYLTKIGFPPGVTVGYAKSQVRDILKGEFNKPVELQVVNLPPNFEFRVVSGPIVYTAISVINALLRYDRKFLNVTPNWVVPDSKHQVQTVLQFVPGYIDVRFCNFSESLEKGLTMAFAEVRRRSGESTNFTVHIMDITTAVPKYENQQLMRQPVDIIFAVSGSRGYLTGSEVSNALLKLTVVEFSYYIGFPVLQIAEPLHYPELNTSSSLRSSWVRTVLLGVLEQKRSERTFQANMERQVAMLLAEAMGQTRRVKRATTVGNNSVQIVNVSRLEGADHPLEIMYFVEGPNGERVPAVQTADLLNRLDLQRAAIILGFRVQGVLAQPVEKVETSPSDRENNNVWIIIGVVILLLLVIIVISILYWKLCRTDKLEFQPDAMSAIQQRQKLQAPSVKGFDFAKLHLGQHNKDDVMVIQEPVPMGSGSGPLPVSAKDGIAPSENGEAPTTKSRTSASSTKASRSSRRRERISPSDGDSVVSDRSSERESTEENLRAHATPSDSKQTRKVPINVLNGKNRIGPPPAGAANEPPTSAAIFEHVDRMSRPADASRRLPNKIQLIAMQPMPVPPLQGPAVNGKLSDTNQMNKEIQAALRHKSEIEHHRNKIRLRAKRKGHYDFPAMDDMIGGLCDAKDQDHIYQKAQNQINKILDPDSQVPPVFMESKKSGRGRRSPKQKLRDQMNGGMMEPDKDHLITEESDAAYRKCPGVNNVAYVSDPDQGPGSPQRSPSPTDDVFLGPASSPPGHAPPPPPYMPPQPSIEEARQQMHSLLDDAFALVSPTSQSSAAGITLPGVNSNLQDSSPPGHGPRAWGPSYQTLGPYPAASRFSDLGMSSATGLTPRQGLGLSLLPPGETAGHGESLQPDSLYSSRGLYTDDVPSSARPRPVGGTTGAQLHHLTQVGLSSRMNGYPAAVRAAPGQNGGLGWNHYHDNNFSRLEAEKDAMHRSGTREPPAPPPHLDTAAVAYLAAPQPLSTPPPTQSSASLIKAIREELLRLSQKQAAVSGYHS
uniref:KIAA1549 n=1 Tax=Iconisemion striatum TaxID=60296 RepID=A0A1A7YMY1_9TELE